jgi:hypothetical protein
MPEVTITDRYADQIPRFVLPKEMTNVEPTPDKAPAAPPVEAKEVKEVTPPVAEAATPEPEKTEPESPETEPDKEKATSRRFEKRIDRAHRRAAEAQARSELLEKQLGELRAAQAPKPSPTVPRMEDFTDVQEYAKAYANHEKDNALKDYQKTQRETQAKQSQAKIVSDWESRASKAASKYEDFEEAVGDLKPTTPWAVAIMRSENGPEIAYHLGTHEPEVKKLLALDPMEQILEIGRLSVRLSTVQDKPKTPSKAPAPITPVETQAKSGTDEIRENQPFEEYRKIGHKMFRQGR